MMRFVSGFEKAEKSRNMEFSLQFLLSFDIIATAFIYYSTTSPGMANSKVVDLTFMCWMGMLAISVYIFNCSTPNTFAKIRVAYRILHLFLIVAAFHRHHVVLVPFIYVIHFAAELGYLMHGIANQKMEYPGKWIAAISNRCHEDHDNQPDSESRFFTSIAREVVRKNCTIDDEFSDDLFDYHTAYEDDLLPTGVFQQKGKSTFIV